MAAARGAAPRRAGRRAPALASQRHIEAAATTASETSIDQRNDAAVTLNDFSAAHLLRVRTELFQVLRVPVEGRDFYCSQAAVVKTVARGSGGRL
eukprot:IDg4319t1